LTYNVTKNLIPGADLLIQTPKVLIAFPLWCIVPNCINLSWNQWGRPEAITSEWKTGWWRWGHPA